MRNPRRATGTKGRAPGARLLAAGAGALWLAGCAGSPALELGESHPANPRAAAAAMTASGALATYRTPQDFAARLAEAASAPAAEGHGAAHGAAGEPVAQADGARPAAVGTVNGVNPERRTVNISHEPIPSLGWPAMTTDLPVAPSVDLGAVRTGSRVTFTLRRGADGLYAIDSLTPGRTGSPSQPAGGGMPGMGHGGMPGPGGGTAPHTGGSQ